MCSIDNSYLFNFPFSQGVPREYLALINIPITLLSIAAPLIIRHTNLPLVWFAGTYVLCLISAIPIAIYVYFTPQMISSSHYYPVLILLRASNNFFVTMRFAACTGFFASISEPRIGGTYMTLLVTVSHLGFAVNSSIVLYAADWLPKRFSYVIAVGACTILGNLWLGCFSRILRRLQKLPTHKWYLIADIIADDATRTTEHSTKGHSALLIQDKRTDQET